MLRTLCESDHEIGDLVIHRGQGNDRYYKSDIKSTMSDYISTYSGSQSEPFLYFERQLLNSYSLCHRVAQKFMVKQKNRRRFLSSIEFSAVSKSIFSSFIVCDIFDSKQYEILVLPNESPLYIFELANDAVSAEFGISSSNNPENGFLKRREVN